MAPFLKPAFSEQNIPIVFSSNQEFAPIMSVMLQSVLEHTSPENHYDIIILTKDINLNSAPRLENMAGGMENASIRVVNVACQLEKYNFYTENRPAISVETYFRLIMPRLMMAYPKAIYLDGDMIANGDVAELFQVDISNYLIASSIDCDSIGRYHKGDLELKEYRDHILKLKDPNTYFCAGMLVMNLELMRKEFPDDELLEFAASYDWRQHDQDVLNVLCQGRAKLISQAWDVLRDAGNNKYMPKELYQQFLEAEKAPKIIHYGGRRKPWVYFDVERGEYFWRYAGKTPFYREILSMVSDANAVRYPPNPMSGTLQSQWNEHTGKDLVLRQYEVGGLGFQYIAKYFKAWLCYKLKRKG